jgi:hypothetical protein
MDDQGPTVGEAPPITTTTVEAELLAVSLNSLTQTLRQAYSADGASARLDALIKLASDTFDWLDDNANSEAPITIEESREVALRVTIENLTHELEHAIKSRREPPRPTDDLLNRIEQSLQQVRDEYHIGP